MALFSVSMNLTLIGSLCKVESYNMYLFVRFPKTLRIKLPNDPSISGYPPERLETIHKDLCSTLFTAAKTTKASIHGHQWTSIEQYSAIRKGEMPPSATTWMGLENINQRQKVKILMISLGLLFPLYFCIYAYIFLNTTDIGLFTII